MVRIVVTVKPGSREPGITVSAAGVEVRVAAPARDGKANDAVRDALAAALGRPKSAVTLARGASARTKAFEIDGLTDAEIRARFGTPED